MTCQTNDQLNDAGTLRYPSTQVNFPPSAIHSVQSSWNTRGDLSILQTADVMNFHTEKNVSFQSSDNGHHVKAVWGQWTQIHTLSIFILQKMETTWKLSGDDKHKYTLSNFSLQTMNTKWKLSANNKHRYNCFADRWRARFQQEWVAGCQSWRIAAPACAWLRGWPAPTGRPPLPPLSDSAAASAPLQQLQATGWHHHLLLLLSGDTSNSSLFYQYSHLNSGSTIPLSSSSI